MADVKTADFISAAAMLVSASLIVFGWWWTARVDRAMKRFERRLDKRQEMLISILEAQLMLREDSTNPLLAAKLSDARIKTTLYGHPEERKRYEALIQAINRHDVPEAQIALEALVPYVMKVQRDELGFTI